MKKAEFEIGEMLKGSGRTLCAAESCTGGMISHLITTVPGSSGYYMGSVTSYSPLIKNKLLEVSPETIQEFGIVSSNVASGMAEGVRRLMGTTYAVATTGWADSYGDEFEPAGTVWIAVTGPLGTETLRFRHNEGRCLNIEAFAAAALDFLKEYIQKDISKSH